MTVLLLGGTAEARCLSHRLADRVPLITSLAGATARPARHGGRLRTGGFGGAEGLERFLRDHGVRLLIDATHPFAERITANAVAACRGAGTPRLRLLRPPWPPEPGWRPLPSLEAALAALPPGARALATTGSLRTAAFAARADCRFLLRTIEDPGPLPLHVTLLRARPPFDADAERATMLAHRVTHLITRNAGGTARGRLDAAAALGLPVLLIERPPEPDGIVVPDVAGAEAEALRILGIGGRHRERPSGTANVPRR